MINYIIIGVLAAVFGVVLTLFLHKLGLWKKKYNKDVEDDD